MLLENLKNSNLIQAFCKYIFDVNEFNNIEFINILKLYIAEHGNKQSKTYITKKEKKILASNKN